MSRFHKISGSEVKPTRAQTQAALDAQDVSRLLRAEVTAPDVKPAVERKPKVSGSSNTEGKKRARSFSVVIVERNFRRRSQSVKEEDIALRLRNNIKREPESTPPREVSVALVDVAAVAGGPAAPLPKYVYDPDKEWPAYAILEEDDTHFLVDFRPTYASLEEVKFWSASVSSRVLLNDGRYWVHWDAEAVVKADVGEGLKAEWAN
ncbi:hypothetical protein P7C70_g3465, partial [Phenoliferia sp. Uapishka_3]